MFALTPTFNKYIEVALKVISSCNGIFSGLITVTGVMISTSFSTVSLAPDPTQEENNIIESPKAYNSFIFILQ